MLLTLTNPTLADSYGNGISDAAEDRGHDDILDYVGIIVPGTNPPLDTRNSEAYSKVLIVVEFRFNAADGVSYRIESSSDLKNWDVVETGIAGTGDRGTRFYTIEGEEEAVRREDRHARVGGVSLRGSGGRVVTSILTARPLSVTEGPSYYEQTYHSRCRCRRSGNPDAC
ncbi:MAG: hypothetical protein QNK82_03910 [Akkermansiaceae bacterium]